MLFFQFPLTSHKTHTQDVPFHHTVYDYFHANLGGFCYHLRDNLWEDIFKLGASTAAASSNCCEWVQVGIDAYLPHHKYQVKPHSSSWFSTACTCS